MYDGNKTGLGNMRRLAKLGDCADSCVICGEPALKTVTAEWAIAHGIPRSLVEGDHVFGRKRDSELIVPLCLTHHWKATVRRIQEGFTMKREHNRIKRVAQCLIGLAIFFEMLAPALRRLANLLRGDDSK